MMNTASGWDTFGCTDHFLIQPNISVKTLLLWCDQTSMHESNTIPRRTICIQIFSFLCVDHADMQLAETWNARNNSRNSRRFSVVFFFSRGERNTSACWVAVMRLHGNRQSEVPHAALPKIQSILVFSFNVRFAFRSRSFFSLTGLFSYTMRCTCVSDFDYLWEHLLGRHRLSRTCVSFRVANTKNARITRLWWQFAGKWLNVTLDNDDGILLDPLCVTFSRSITSAACVSVTRYVRMCVESWLTNKAVKSDLYCVWWMVNSF